MSKNSFLLVIFLASVLFSFIYRYNLALKDSSPTITPPPEEPGHVKTVVGTI